MISLKIVTEFSETNCKFASVVADLLPNLGLVQRRLKNLEIADNLHKALKAISLVDDDPITLSDDPKFRVVDANSNSILGRLLNPDNQSMSRMILQIPSIWRVYDRVRGIALNRLRLSMRLDVAVFNPGFGKEMNEKLQIQTRTCFPVQEYVADFIKDVELHTTAKGRKSFLSSSGMLLLSCLGDKMLIKDVELHFNS